MYVSTDRAQGVTSLADGQLDVLLHRWVGALLVAAEPVCARVSAVPRMLTAVQHCDKHKPLTSATRAFCPQSERAG